MTVVRRHFFFSRGLRRQHASNGQLRDDSDANVIGRLNNQNRLSVAIV